MGDEYHGDTLFAELVESIEAACLKMDIPDRQRFIDNKNLRVDMDRDGDLDLLIAGRGSKNVVWYENPRKG